MACQRLAARFKLVDPVGVPTCIPLSDSDGSIRQSALFDGTALALLPGDTVMAGVKTGYRAPTSSILAAKNKRQKSSTRLFAGPTVLSASDVGKGNPRKSESQQAIRQSLLPPVSCPLGSLYGPRRGLLEARITGQPGLNAKMRNTSRHTIVRTSAPCPRIPDFGYPRWVRDATRGATPSPRGELRNLKLGNRPFRGPWGRPVHPRIAGRVGLRVRRSGKHTAHFWALAVTP